LCMIELHWRSQLIPSLRRMAFRALEIDVAMR